MTNEVFYKQIVQDASFGYAYHEILHDTTGNPVDYCYIEVNKAFEKMTGLKAEAIRGKTAKQLFPQIGESTFDWIKVYGEVASTGNPQKFEQYFEPLKCWFRVEVSSPAKGYFITLLTDISAIKANEAVTFSSAEKSRHEGKERISDEFAATALQLSEQKFAKAFHLSPNIIGLSDFDTDEYVEVNQAFFDIMEYSPDDIKGVKVKDLVRMESSFREKALAMLKEKGSVRNLETILFSKSGRPVHVLLSADIITINNKKYNFTTGVDITERKKIEQELLDSEKRCAFLANTATDLASLTTVNDIYIYTAQKINEMLNGQGILAIVEYDLKTNRWKSKHMVGIGKWINDLTQLLGFDLRNLEGEISTKYIDKITSGNLVELEFDFPGLFNNKISGMVGNAAKKMLGVDKMYCMAFQKSNQLLGNITFTTNKKTGTFNTGLIEAFVGLVSNFLQRLIAEKEQRKSESRYRAYVDNAPLGVFVVEQNGTYIEVNEEACRITGYTADELLGKKFGELIDPESMESAGAHFAKVIKEGRATGEIAFRTKTGEKHWWNVVGAQLSSERILGIAEDITARKNAEETLKLKSEILAKLFMTSRILNESIDKKTILQKITDTAVTLTQMESSAIYLIEESDLYLYATHPPLPATYPDEFRRAKLEHHWHINKTVETKDIVVLQDALQEKLTEQEEIIVKTSGFRTLIYLPLIHEDVVQGVIILGTISCLHQFTDEELSFFRTFANLSSTALANSKLFDENREYNERLKLLNRAVESSSVSIVITDAKGDVSYVNPYFSQLTGYSYEEVLGKNPRILQSGNQPTTYYQELWNTLLLGQDWTGEFQNKKKNGELFWERATISPILSSDGKVTNFVAIKEDITERKKILEELIEAKEKAEESDKLKTAFINNISHEIRTPLNGILGFGQIMSESNLSEEERREFLTHLEKSSDRLMNTVTDYMDMAMLVSNTMKVNKKEFVMESVFEIITSKTLKLCAERQIVFIPQITNETASITINSDPEFIQKILEKLLDNAVKYTIEGSITCGCKITSHYISLFVKDTGIGIEQDKLELIFEVFSQADYAMTRGYEGSGLGLTIAKVMVTLLGGEITVVSEIGKGSEFTVTIPINNSDMACSFDASISPMPQKTKKPLILVAEDDETNYEYLAIVLKSLGHNHIHAVNGKEAVDICRQNPDVSLVLMDIKMPVLNGDDATKQIRVFRPELPIIAITAHALTGDEPRFLEAGCTDYLAKPILKNKLLALISKYVE